MASAAGPVDDYWEPFLLAAEQALRAQRIYTSPVQGQRYRVQSVGDDRVTVARLDANEPTVVTRFRVNREVRKVIDAGGRIGRGSLFGTVAKETTLVELHPLLRRDASGDWIELTAPAKSHRIEESPAPDADPDGRYWALAADPSTYRIEEAVRAIELDWWTTKDRPIREGDRLVIWKTKGKDGRRGIVAFGEVVGEPVLRDTSADPYWLDSVARPARMQVPVVYEVPPGLPLWIDGPHAGIVAELSVARARGGTVFHVSPAQWAALRQAAAAENFLQLPPIQDVTSRVVGEGEHLFDAKKRPPGNERATGGSRQSPPRRSPHAKRIGDRAEVVVVEHLRRSLPSAANVRWLASMGQTPGWDIEYLNEAGVRVAVEVKGTTAKSFPNVEVTSKEWDAAQRLGVQYHLYLVARCTSTTPVIEVMRDPYALLEAGGLQATPAMWCLEFTY